jgi:hypothetical protein
MRARKKKEGRTGRKGGVSNISPPKGTSPMTELPSSRAYLPKNSKFHHLPTATQTGNSQSTDDFGRTFQIQTIAILNLLHVFKCIGKKIANFGQAAKFHLNSLSLLS